MSGQRPRRIRYIPTPHTMAIALNNAAKPARADVTEILQAVHAAHTALRRGVGTELQWAILSGTLAVAHSIHKMGVVRDIDGHLAAADVALQTIHDRATASGHWQAPALWFDEMESLEVFVELHALRARQLGRAEFLRAIELAATSIKTAGHTPHLVRSVPAQISGAHP